MFMFVTVGVAISVFINITVLPDTIVIICYYSSYGHYCSFSFASNYLDSSCRGSPAVAEVRTVEVEAWKALLC